MKCFLVLPHDFISEEKTLYLYKYESLVELTGAQIEMFYTGKIEIPEGKQRKAGTLELEDIPPPSTEQIAEANEVAAIHTRFDAVYAPLDTTHGLIDVGRGKDGILGMENIKDAVAAHGSGLTEIESVAWIMHDNSVATLTIADLNQIIVDFNLRKQDIFTAYREWRAGDKQEAFTL